MRILNTLVVLSCVFFLAGIAPASAEEGEGIDPYPTSYWLRSDLSGQAEVSMDVATAHPTAPLGFVLAGYFNGDSTSQYDNDGFIMKTDLDGNVEFFESWGGSLGGVDLDDRSLVVASRVEWEWPGYTHIGHYIAGTSYYPGGAPSWLELYAFDEVYNHSHTFSQRAHASHICLPGGGKNPVPTSILTPDIYTSSAIYVLGSKSFMHSPDMAAFVMELGSSSLHLNVFHEFPVSSSHWSAYGAVATASLLKTDDGYAFSGYAEVDGGSFQSDVFVYATDDSFNVVDREMLITPDTFEKVYAMVEYGGGFVLAGSIAPTRNGPWNIYVLKVNEALEVEWKREYAQYGSDDSDDEAKDIVAAPGGGLMVTGYTTDSGQRRPFLLRLYADGSPVSFTVVNPLTGAGPTDSEFTSIDVSSEPAAVIASGFVRDPNMKTLETVLLGHLPSLAIK